MAADSLPRISVEEYLELDRAAEVRHEFYGGKMYAMPGGSFWHGLLIGNLTGLLKDALKGRGCYVVPSDLRLAISSGLYTYPDVSVICGEVRLADRRSDTVLNPSVIIEVLSPSTEAYDRGFKFAQYRGLASLREYVLVSQAEFRVEAFLRQDGGAWILNESVGAEASVVLRSLDLTIPLAAIYEGVVFPEPAEGAAHPEPSRPEPPTP